MDAHDWDAYIAWLVERHGTLAAVADRLAEDRGHRESTESIERALRRLRGRGTRDGGSWGQRLVRKFGLADAVLARLRFMGTYHSRFTDLPVPICEDLVRAWDAPPTTDSPVARLWIGLARATIAMRGNDAKERRGCSATLRPPLRPRRGSNGCCWSTTSGADRRGTRSRT